LRKFEWSAKPFGEFFGALTDALDSVGVHYCILRNYEGFPANNLGNDIDFLISRSDLQRAMCALRSVEAAQIIGYLERASVASVYLEGISHPPELRALEVDFDLNLAWKGLSFLTTDSVFQAAIRRTAGSLTFWVPSPIHEAIMSFFTSFLIGGCLKEKYFAQVQRTFASERSGVIAALLPQFGLKTTTHLVDAVIGGDRRKVLGCVRSLRISLALRSLLRQPIRSVLAVVNHYANEFAIRLSPKTLETVCLLSPEGGARTAIIEALMPMLRSCAGVVEKRRPQPWLHFERISTGTTTNAEPRATAQPGSLVSMAKVVSWLLSDWLSQLWGKKNLTLRIWDTCSYDLVVDPDRYRYGGPEWFARLVSKLFPSPDLWIFLDPVAEGAQSKSRQVLPAEILSQLEAYRAFIQAQKKYVILDASQPADGVTERAYAAIIGTLGERADRKLKDRFKQRKPPN